MKANSTPFTGNNTTTLVFGILAALLVIAVLTGKKLPLLGDERVSLIVLVVLGMAMCTNGIGRVAAAGAWMHPLALLDIFLGVVTLLAAAAGIFNWQIPFISSPRQAIIAVSVLSVAKLLVSVLHRVIRA